MKQYVLTAAHCIAWGRDALKLRVVIGDHDLDKRTETRSSFKAQVRSLKLHIRYKNSTVLNDYDIGLIKLRYPIHFNQDVRPICLPRFSRLTFYASKEQLSKLSAQPLYLFLSSQTTLAE